MALIIAALLNVSIKIRQCGEMNGEIHLILYTLHKRHKKAVFYKGFFVRILFFWIIF